MNVISLRCRKAGRVWFGGARETHWATCPNGVTVSKRKQSIKSPWFLYINKLYIIICIWFFMPTFRCKSIFKKFFLVKIRISNKNTDAFQFKVKLHKVQASFYNIKLFKTCLSTIRFSKTLKAFIRNRRSINFTAGAFICGFTNAAIFSKSTIVKTLFLG